MAKSILERSGIRHRTVDTTDHAAVEAALDGGAKLLWLETISNPTTAMADVAALAELAHARGVLVGVDNTFASPALANPLAHGADFVVHSTTKYVGGHSDLMGGAVVGSAERDRCRPPRDGQRRRQRVPVGGVPGAAWPEDPRAAHGAPLVERAGRLAGARGRARRRGVRYPGLESHPQHELACRVLRGGMAGGMVALELAGGREHGERFLSRVRVAVHATSLGSVETLVSHPASSSHRQLTDA